MNSDQLIWRHSQERSIVYYEVLAGIRVNILRFSVLEFKCSGGETCKTKEIHLTGLIR